MRHLDCSQFRQIAIFNAVQALGTLVKRLCNFLLSQILAWLHLSLFDLDIELVVIVYSKNPSAQSCSHRAAPVSVLDSEFWLLDVLLQFVYAALADVVLVVRKQSREETLRSHHFLAALPVGFLAK